MSICFQTSLNMFHLRLLSSITGPTQPQGSEPPSFESAPSTSPIPEETDQDKTEHGGNKRVCFKVNEDDQEDSGHDTMSYRDSYRWGTDCEMMFMKHVEAWVLKGVTQVQVQPATCPDPITTLFLSKVFKMSILIQAPIFIMAFKLHFVFCEMTCINKI